MNLLIHILEGEYTTFVCIKHIQMEGVEHKNPQSKQDRENSVSSFVLLNLRIV